MCQPTPAPLQLVDYIFDYARDLCYKVRNSGAKEGPWAFRYEKYNLKLGNYESVVLLDYVWFPDNIKEREKHYKK